MEAKMQQLSHSQDLVQTIIYLMGTSFVLGSLITIFLLMILDMIHRSKDAKKGGQPPQA